MVVPVILANQCVFIGTNLPECIKTGIKMLRNGKRHHQASWNRAIKLPFCCKVVPIPQALSSLCLTSNNAVRVRVYKARLKQNLCICLYTTRFLKCKAVVSKSSELPKCYSLTLWCQGLSLLLLLTDCVCACESVCDPVCLYVLIR